MKEGSRTHAIWMGRFDVFLKRGLDERTTFGYQSGLRHQNDRPTFARQIAQGSNCQPGSMFPRIVYDNLLFR